MPYSKIVQIFQRVKISNLTNFEGLTLEIDAPDLPKLDFTKGPVYIWGSVSVVLGEKAQISNVYMYL